MTETAGENAISTMWQSIQENPWKVVGYLVGAWVTKALLDYITRPKSLPPFYWEHPYIPWLGSLVQFATGPREFLQRAAASQGDIFTIQLFGKQMTFLLGTEGHATFFKAREQEFDIREAYAMTVTTFGPGVCYDCPQSTMAQQFAYFKDGLSDAKFVQYMQLVQEEVAGYFEQYWGDEGEADLLTSLSDLFTLTSSRCLLGEEVRKRWKDSGMAEHYLALDHSFVPILFFFPSIPNPHKTKCLNARKLFSRMFQEIIQERQQKEANDPNYQPPSDFLQVLMAAEYRDGRKLNLDEITGILIGVLLGGQHTSNVTGTWLMAHLLKDPVWLEKVLKEQESLFDKKAKQQKGGLHPNTLTYEDAQNMPIFEQVLSETLRLHPPFFQLSRSVKVSKEFQGYTIPKGHYVNVSPGAAQRLPQLWGATAESFDPSRMTPESKKEAIRKHAWIPFGGGMHQCGGRKFAWNSHKVSLAWLLRNYDLEFVGKGADDLPHEDYTTMVVAPTSSHCRVRYRRKTAAK